MDIANLFEFCRYEMMKFNTIYNKFLYTLVLKKLVLTFDIKDWMDIFHKKILIWISIGFKKMHFHIKSQLPKIGEKNVDDNFFLLIYLRSLYKYNDSWI